MAEIEIESSCFVCNTDFDDSEDCKTCSVCEQTICEDCQPDHAVKHCFELEHDDLKKLLTERYKKKK